MTEPGDDSPAPRKAPAKKAPAKTEAAKKAPAKKAAAKKAPAKKAAAKKAPAKKAPAKKASAKKASAKKGRRIAAARERARSAPMSKYFTRARTRAQRMLNDPEALQRVAEESYKSGASRSGPFAEVMDEFRTLVRLVVAYARGNYRDVPADTMAIVVGGLVYVVSPLDLFPDPIPVVGYLDDAAVVVWVVKHVREELDAFRAWELGQ